MLSVHYLLVLLITSLLVSAQHLPKFIKPCKASDPLVNECLVKNGNNALSALSRGNKFLFSPLWTASKAEGWGSDTFKLTQTNVRFYKLDTMKITNASYNNHENSMGFVLETPELTFTSKYDMDVTLLGKHIVGKGDMNGTLEGVISNIKIFMKTIERETKEYYNIHNSTFEMVLNKAVSSFENLYYSGVEDNQFINENWKEFTNYMLRDWNEFMNGYTVKLFGLFLKRVPKDKFLLP